MKRLAPITLLLSTLVVFHVAQAQPLITVQPQSRTNNVGDSARFSVTASGTGVLTYQWKYQNEDIPDATNSAVDVLVTSATQTGDYSVLVGDDVGTTPSTTANISIPYGNRTKIAGWDFNSNPPDANTATGTLNPSIGSGSIGIVGAITYVFAVASPSDPAVFGTDNSGWQGSTWGGSASANKSRGLQVNVNTAAYKDIVVTWEERHQGSASRYVRLQYTINGTDWVDHTVHEMTSGGTYFFRSSELIGIPGVDNNPLFAVRITPEWQSTATGGGTAGFVGTTTTYSSAGNIFMDMISVFGTVFTPAEEQPVIITQPVSQTNYIGADVSFEVVATGGNLKYQWRFSGGNIPGATEATLLLDDIDTGNEGTYSVFITNSAGEATSEDVYLAVLPPPAAGDRYWSGNGSSVGGLGTWDTTSQRWGTSSAGPFGLVWNNENHDPAFFEVPAGAVTIGEPIVVSKISVVGNANYSFSGANMLTFTNEAEMNCTSTAGSSAVTFTCPLGADTMTKTGAGRMHLNNTGNNVNRFVANGGVISVQNGSSLGTAPAELVPDRITLDNAGLGFEGVSPNLSATRGLKLGPGGGELAVRSGGVVCTIHAPITGPGGIAFPTFSGFHGSGIYGANETFVFNNPANDYQGDTTITCSELRLGADEVLPNTTTLILSGGNTSSARGRLNLNGRTETVASVIVSGAGGAIFGAGSLTATNYDIRQSRTGGGQLGLMSVLAGDANLTKSTAGEAELGAENTYTGDTLLVEGKVYLSGPGRFGNGAGTLHIIGTNAFGDAPVTVAVKDTQESVQANPVVFATSNPGDPSKPELTVMADSTATGDVVYVSSGEWTVPQGSLYVFNGSGSATFALALAGEANFEVPTFIQIADLTVTLGLMNPEASEQVFAGTITGGGGVRRSVLSGLGGTTIFAADNSYSGDTVIDAGTLLVNNPNPFASGTGYGNVSVGGTGALGGTGGIAGAVTVTVGGSISAGASAGVLTLQNGLDLSNGGSNVWDLATLADSSSGVAGTDFDQLVLSGGELQLGGSSKLVLRFASGTAPNSVVPFWQSARSWTIVNLNGGLNTANATFASIVNGTYNAGTFSTAAVGGNIVLSFTPSAPSAPQFTTHPVSRTNIVGTSASFTVAASGSDPLAFTWFRSEAPFTPIPGATSATYIIPSVQASHAGSYFARVSNGLGNDTSQTATLTIAPQPQIQSPSVVGGNVTLNWGAVPGTFYQVQYTTDIGSDSWMVLTNLVADDFTLSVTDTPPGGSSQRFYRLVIQ